MPDHKILVYQSVYMFAHIVYIAYIQHTTYIYGIVTERERERQTYICTDTFHAVTPWPIRFARCAPHKISQYFWSDPTKRGAHRKTRQTVVEAFYRDIQTMRDAVDNCTTQHTHTHRQYVSFSFVSRSAARRSSPWAENMLQTIM